MRKLPVFATAARVYSFIFQEMGTIFRLSWFPLLVIQIALLLIERTAAPSQQLAYSATSLLYFFVSFGGFAIVAVSLHRVALFGDRRPCLYIYFAFGKIEFLFGLVAFVEMATLWVSIVVLAMSLFLPMGFFGLGTDATKMFAALVCLLPVIYVMARLSVIFPIIVAERRISLTRSWELTRENAWRIVSVWLLTVGPLEVIDFAVEQLSPEVDPVASLDFSSPMTAGTFIFNFLIKMTAGALGVASLSYSYKELSGLAPDDVLTPEA